MTRDNSEYGSSSKETQASYSLKPAAVTVERDGEQIEIDAVHHYRNDRDTLLFLCIEEREGGSDVVVPLCSDKHAYATSEVGREALGMDGGECEAPQCSNRTDDADAVYCSRECAAVAQAAQELEDGVSESDLARAGVARDTIDAAVAAVSDDDSDDDGRGRLMTDGGQDIPGDADGDGWEWVSEGPQNIRPPKKFVHTQCGGRAARGHDAHGETFFWCPECDVTESLKSGFIRIERVDGDDDDRRLMTDGGQDIPDADDVTESLSDMFDGGNNTNSGDSDTPEPAETLPADLRDDDDDDYPLAGDPDGARVDPDDIKTPRPVTRTIGARSLHYDGHPNDVLYSNLPGRATCPVCLAEWRAGDLDEHEDDGDDDDGEVWAAARYGDDEDEDPAHLVRRRAVAQHCEHDTNSDGIQFDKSAARRRRVADAVDYDYDTDDDGEEERVSLYGVVVARFEDDGEFDPHLSVRIADTTGVVDVDLHPRMTPLAEFEPGDEILVTECRRLDGDDSEPAFGVTESSSLLRVAYRPDRDPREALQEQTQLTETPRKYQTMENKTAVNNWIADVLVDEWTIETPRGGDEMYVYIDDSDSERYGEFADEGKTRIEEIVDQYIPPESNNPRNKNQIVKTVRHRTYVPSDAFRGGAPDTEARRWSVGVKNGVIDLRDGELYEHDPAWRCTSKLPIEYNPEYDELGDAWDRFLDDVCKDVADRETLLYMLGHALARHYPIEALFAIIGPGKNGKTVLNKAMSPLFGDAKGTTDIGMMTDPGYEFGAGSVKGLHLAIDDDATDVKAQDISLLKKLSGGAKTQMHEKKEKVSGADYDNYGTIVYLSNDPPLLGDKTDGATRRLYPVIMPHKFTSDPTDGHKDAVSKDELLADLTSDEELQRLLAVAVQYAQDIHRDCEDELPVGRSEDERWSLYQQYSDSVLQFWTELMTQETGARVPRAVVYEIYVQWAAENGIDALASGGKNGFWQLSDECPAVSYKRDGVYSDGDRAVEHVMITSDALDYAPEWVRDEWRDDVSEDESTLANRLDRVTPIEDLNKGYSTTAGTVIGREGFETSDGSAVRVTIEDFTTAIDVFEWLDSADADAALDGVDVGDRITLERATLTSGSGGEPQLQVKNVTEVTVSEAGPLKDVDDRHADDTETTDDEGDADDGGLSQEDRVQAVKNVIGSLQNRTDVRGAGVDDVIDAAADRGIDRSKAEHELDKLRRKGDVYEPQTGRVTLTSGGD
ncbi:DNA primase family protein [Halostella pelagica]|uniref:DNA primase family protein n=1 Tax=Halostella pelagica TaxID=2583824 RepID=UPI001080F55E|nr:phage/plasmid primase, P4 family [Halostella pelagica]